MDNLEHKSLNLLYLALLSNPAQNLNNLSEDLRLTQSQLIADFKRLESMGLSLLYGNKTVRLNHSIDAIDLDFLQKILASNNIKKAIYYRFSCVSTNQLAANNKQPSIYISDHQSQGKGRQNKTWLTPLGQSIALSISHKFNCSLRDVSGLNIAIGVAIIKTTEQFGCNENGLGLKWPNDVLGKNGKAAGILIEVSGNNKSCFVVIGIGLNWTVRQSILDSVDRECMNVGVVGVSRTKFMAALIVNVHETIHEFSQNKLKNILAIWNKYDCYKNKNINVIQNKASKLAKYIGIDPRGYLVVETQGKKKLLASGEVTIRKVD